MPGCLQCLKILYIHNCWNLFFYPRTVVKLRLPKKISNFRIDFFYRSVISPFAVKLFLLPFSSHCSTQNIGFSDSAYVNKFLQPSSAVYGAPPFPRHLQIMHITLIFVCKYQYHAFQVRFWLFLNVLYVCFLLFSGFFSR